MTVVLSFATVTLNDLEGLQRTHRSLVQMLSTDERIEWVVWDGGSSDGSIAWLKTVQSAHWQSGPDGGIYDAMNRATVLTTGQYVTYLNSGDEWLDREVMEKLPYQPEGTILYGSYVLRLQNGRSLLRQARRPGYLRYGLPTSHQAIIFPKIALLAAGLYDTSLRVAGDYDLVYRMVMAGVSLQRQQAVFSRFHAGGTSTRQRQLLSQEAAAVQQTVGGDTLLYVRVSRLRRYAVGVAVSVIEKVVR